MAFEDEPHVVKGVVWLWQRLLLSLPEWVSCACLRGQRLQPGSGVTNMFWSSAEMYWIDSCRWRIIWRPCYTVIYFFCLTVNLTLYMLPRGCYSSVSMHTVPFHFLHVENILSKERARWKVAELTRLPNWTVLFFMNVFQSGAVTRRQIHWWVISWFPDKASSPLQAAAEHSVLITAHFCVNLLNKTWSCSSAESKHSSCSSF